MARRVPKTPKAYVVDQEQDGLWVQVAAFRSKAAAERFAPRLPGRTRIVYTWPSAHDHPVISPGGPHTQLAAREAPRGIYHSTGVQEGDYVIYVDHRGAFRADRIGRGGTHTTIGSTRGYATARDALKDAARDSHIQGNATGAVFLAYDEEVTQIGNIEGSRFVPSGDDTMETIERFVIDRTEHLRFFDDADSAIAAVPPDAIDWVVSGIQYNAVKYIKSIDDVERPDMREAPRVVADFNTLDSLISHARDEGASHVLVDGYNTKLYFPRGGQYPYEEASVWRKASYWHAQGPGARTGVARLPEGAQRIGGGAGDRRAAEAPRRRPAPLIDDKLYSVTWNGGRQGPMTKQAVVELVRDLRQQWRDRGGRPNDILGIRVYYRDGSPVAYADLERQVLGTHVETPRRRTGRVEDYIAVDRRGRKTAGPFKSYGDASDAAGPADVVQFVPAKSRSTLSERSRPETLSQEAREYVLQNSFWSTDGYSLVPVEDANREIAHALTSVFSAPRQYPNGSFWRIDSEAMSTLDSISMKRMSEAKLPGDSGPPYTIEELNTVLGTRRHPPTPYGSFDEAVQAALAKAGRVRSFVTIVILDRKERPVTDFVGTAG